MPALSSSAEFGREPGLHRQLVAILSETLLIDFDPTVDDVLRADYEVWDSFNHLRLVLALEEAFALSLDLDEVAAIESLSGIMALLRARGISAAPVTE